MTPNLAILGPVSASRSSTFADESALTLDDLDHAFLDNATAVWQIGRAIPLPGIGSQRHGSPDFLPTHHANVPAAHHRIHPNADEEHERIAHSHPVVPLRERQLPTHPNGFASTPLKTVTASVAVMS